MRSVHVMIRSQPMGVEASPGGVRLQVQKLDCIIPGVLMKGLGIKEDMRDSKSRFGPGL